MFCSSAGTMRERRYEKIWSILRRFSCCAEFSEPMADVTEPTMVTDIMTPRTIIAVVNATSSAVEGMISHPTPVVATMAQKNEGRVVW